MRSRVSRDKECGVIVPLAAVVLAGAIALLFATGVDSLLIRLTRSELQRATNAVCLSLASEALAPDSAAPAFQVAVTALQGNLSFASLESAALVLPLPREDQLPSLDPKLACSGNLPSVDDYAAVPASGNGEGVSFRAAGLPPCDLKGNDCELWAYPNLRLPAGFPEAVKPALLPGRSVGCELSAKVKRFSGGEPVTIVARALYSTRQRNAGGPKPHEDFGDFSQPSALRIAIGTEMSTPSFARLSAAAPGGLFDVGAPLTFAATRLALPNGTFPENFFEYHDPFWSPPLDSADTWGDGTYLSDPPIPGNPYKFLRTVPVSGFLRAFSAPRPITPLTPLSSPYELPNPTNPGFFRGGWQLSDSQQKEMLVACANPPALIRNIVAQTLVELAARDPALRHRTEILHINPRNVPYDPTKPSPPTQMVPLGVDITSRAFQIPFLQYTQDDYKIEGNLVIGLGAVPRISPFSDQQNLTPDEVSIHATLASQLRACYHLYTGHWDGAGLQTPYKGLSRFDFPKLFDSAYGFLSNGAGAFQFDEVLYPGTGDTTKGRYRREVTTSDPSLPSDVGGAYAGKHFRPQEQENPWLGDDWGGTHTRLLTAGELVSSLGSSQRCPYSDIEDPVNPNKTLTNRRYVVRCPTNPPPTPDPPRTTNPPPSSGNDIYPSKDSYYSTPLDSKIDTGGELLPDLLGLFNYVNEPNSLPVRALKSPGLAHNPVQIEIKGQADCSNASLVVILNNLLPPYDFKDESPSDHKKILKQVFADFRKKNPFSPLMVFYIPGTPFQAQGGVSQNSLMTMLGVLDAQDPYFSFISLSPPCWDCKESDLHKYWAELLDPDSPTYIVPMVRRLFAERLYHLERVL